MYSCRKRRGVRWLGICKKTQTLRSQGKMARCHGFSRRLIVFLYFRGWIPYAERFVFSPGLTVGPTWATCHVFLHWSQTQAVSISTCGTSDGAGVCWRYTRETCIRLPLVTLAEHICRGGCITNVCSLCKCWAVVAVSELVFAETPDWTSYRRAGVLSNQWEGAHCGGRKKDLPHKHQGVQDAARQSENHWILDCWKHWRAPLALFPHEIIVGDI